VVAKGKRQRQLGTAAEPAAAAPNPSGREGRRRTERGEEERESRRLVGLIQLTRGHGRPYGNSEAVYTPAGGPKTSLSVSHSVDPSIAQL